MTTTYMVEIVNYDTGIAEKKIGPFNSKCRAEKAEDGVIINLNHDEYYTRIAEKSSEDDGKKPSLASQNLLFQLESQNE